MNLPNLRLPRLRYDRVAWALFVLIVVLVWLSSVARKKGSIADETVVFVKPLAGGQSDKFITEKEVRTAIFKAFGQNLDGTEVGELEVERIETALEQDPFVRDCNAYVDAHNQIHVDIEQREPLLRILDNTGGNYYLDKSGAKMPASKNYAAHVLVATGNIPPYTPDFQEKRRNVHKDLFALTNALLADEFLKDFVQQIHVSSTGDYVLVPLIGDQKIILGSAKRLDSKLRRLKIFYREGMPYAGWNRYSSINLKYSGQVVCKR